MPKLTEEEYDKRIRANQQALYEAFGRLKVDYSWDRLTDQQFNLECKLLLSSSYREYQDIVFKQADGEH